MTSEMLFGAIGMMEETFLEESMAEREHSPKRIVWRTVLAAAIIASLALSVVAVVVTGLYGRTQRNQQEWEHKYDTELIVFNNASMLDIYLNIPELSDTPGEILNFYAPTIFPKEELSSCYANEGDCIREFHVDWNLSDVRDGTSGKIGFTQWCCDDYDPGEPVDSLLGTVFTESDVQTEKIQWKGREYFFVGIDPVTDSDFGTFDNLNYLYWTDGEYVFKMNFPCSMEISEAMEIIESVEKVPDIQSWLDIAAEMSRERIKNSWKERVDKMTSEEPYEEALLADEGWTEVTEQGYVKVSVCLPLAFRAEWGKREIERLVYPRYFEDREAVELNGSWDNYTVKWEAPEYGEGARIWFRQDSGKFYSERKDKEIVAGKEVARNPVFEFYIFDMDNPEDMESGMTELGDYHLFEVSFEKGTDGTSGARYFFWTDGTYAFCLRTPYAMGDSEILNIIESIR